MILIILKIMILNIQRGDNPNLKEEGERGAQTSPSSCRAIDHVIRFPHPLKQGQGLKIQEGGGGTYLAGIHLFKEKTLLFPEIAF